MIARRTGAVLTIALMLACVVPAVVIPLVHHALLGLFAPDLGAAVGFAVVGAFLLVRGAVTGIAVILCIQGVGASTTVLTGVLSTLAADAGPLRGVSLWVDWASDFLWLPGVVLLAPFVLLFPDGRLKSAGWRWPIRINAALAGLYVVGGVVYRGPLLDGKPESYAPNPTGFVRFGPTALKVFEAFNGAVVLGFMLVLLVSLGAVISRRRAARGVERAQLTCLLFGGAMTVFLVTVLGFSPQNVWTFALGLIAVLPIAMAIAVGVLRYRLYEIDRLVSRTVAYALVLAVLIAVYVVVVTGLVAVVPARFGQLGVAAATLVVSLLAAPLTRRARRAVDRRFNRRRYNAEQLVTRYAEALRRPGEDSTVDSIAAGLVTAASRAVEPRSASVWLVARSSRGA